MCIGNNINGNIQPKCYTTSVTIPTNSIITTTPAASDGTNFYNNNNISKVNNNSLADPAEDNEKNLPPSPADCSFINNSNCISTIKQQQVQNAQDCSKYRTETCI